MEFKLLNHLISINKDDKGGMDGILKKHGITKKQFLGDCRIRELVRARKEVIIYLKDEKGLSFAEIGRLMNKHHTSIIHHYYAK